MKKPISFEELLNCIKEFNHISTKSNIIQSSKNKFVFKVRLNTNKELWCIESKTVENLHVFLVQQNVREGDLKSIIL